MDDETIKTLLGEISDIEILDAEGLDFSEQLDKIKAILRAELQD